MYMTTKGTGFRIHHIKRVLPSMSSHEQARLSRMLDDKEEFAVMISLDEVVKLCMRAGLEFSLATKGVEYDTVIVPRWVVEAVEQYGKMDGGFADLTIEEYLARMTE